MQRRRPHESGAASAVSVLPFHEKEASMDTLHDRQLRAIACLGTALALYGAQVVQPAAHSEPAPAADLESAQGAPVQEGIPAEDAIPFF